MNIIPLLWRNMRWRFENKITIVVTIIQPIIWLILYSSISSSYKGNYTAFILPGIMILVLFSSCSSSGMMNYIMKSQGSFYRLLIAPLTRQSIVFAQNLEAILLSFIEIFLLVIISLFMSVSFHLNIFSLFAIFIIIFLSAFLCSNIAYTISLKLPNEMSYETMMNMLVLPLFFASTALFPLHEIEGGVRYIILLNPFSHVIHLIRELMFQTNIDVAYFIFVIVLLLILSIPSFLLSCHTLKKEHNL